MQIIISLVTLDSFRQLYQARFVSPHSLYIFKCSIFLLLYLLFLKYLRPVRTHTQH